MFRLVFLPVKLFFLLLRVLGPVKFVVLVVGIAIGLMLAPTSGAELREKLQAKLQGADPDAGTIPAV